MPRVVNREARRAELVSAAAAVFAQRGVANTVVSDIVKQAGVAQGTFYLYFDSKDDAVLAVVESMAAAIIESMTVRIGAVSSAVDKLLVLSDVLSEAGSEPEATELIDLMHRRENRVLHDRLAEGMTPPLVELMETIVEQGVAEGVFLVDDTRAAAWFVLGGLRSIELAGTAVDKLPAALAEATELALRALGYQGPRP
jgi:TetR/AcrR family fatty acid metabolism transcriptional regulator